MAHELFTFVCPRCHRAEAVNISKYIQENNTAAIEKKCECGHVYQGDLERRQHNRKAVKFSGRYHYRNEIQLEPGVVAGKLVGKGKMTVLDLSISGLKMKFKKKEDLKINDSLSVEFHLKDYKRTLIRETAKIKNIHNQYIGGAFTFSGAKSRDLGFYLLG